MSHAGLVGTSSSARASRLEFAVSKLVCTDSERIQASVNGPSGSIARRTEGGQLGLIGQADPLEVPHVSRIGDAGGRAASS